MKKWRWIFPSRTVAAQTRRTPLARPCPRMETARVGKTGHERPSRSLMFETCLCVRNGLTEITAVGKSAGVFDQGGDGAVSEQRCYDVNSFKESKTVWR